MSSLSIPESSAEPGWGHECETTYQGILDQREERIRSSEIPHPTSGNYNHTFNHIEVASAKPHSYRPLSQKHYGSNIPEAQSTAAYKSLQSELDPGASVELRDLSAPQLHTLWSREEQLTPNSSSAQSSQGGLIMALLRHVKTVLLRSSSAAGVSSYGAIPTIPIYSDTSSLEGETVSDEEARRGYDERDNHEEQGQDRVYGERDEECVVGAKSRMRKRSGVMGPQMLGPSRALGEEFGESLGIGIGPGLGPEEAEQYDENDPPDNSPYAEVRAAVLASDDTSLSINTPRMWFFSILFSLIGSATNLFFSLRYPSVFITPIIALILAHPLGLLWDNIFRDSSDEDSNDLEVNTPLGGKLKKVRRWLGQGKWNRKEHCCVYISSNVSFGFAFATDVIVEQTHFYHQDPGVLYQILLTLSTQILGYTFAGLTRQWLVYPAGMIWPSTLVSTAMFTTLHGAENIKSAKENEPATGWTITRYKFFIVVFLVSFFWYFFPGLLAPFLSYFNVITWFAPKSVVIANLFGVSSGLGMFPLTFDWAQISYTGSPLLTPFWAAMNVIIGLVIVMWIIAPIMYYKNYFFSAYMPVVSSVVFDNTGKPYDVTKILTKEFLFDGDAYKRYSKVFMPITYVLSYGLQFAALAALITQTILWHGKDIVHQWKRSRQATRVWGTGAVESAYAPILNTTALPAINPAVLEAYKQRKKSMKQTPRGLSRHRSRSFRRNSIDERALIDLMDGEDVHMRLMRAYKEAPPSWYLMTFGVMLVVGIFVVEYYPVHLPWYGLLLALVICGVFFVPIGIVMAITNQQSSLYLVCQLVCGTVFPGRPVANMVFVTYGYITSTQGLKFSSDLKLGHYMKIPPRLLFSVQMVATIISSLMQIGVLNWIFANVRGICTLEAVNGFTCPIARVHFNGSILWGLVGPGKFFGNEGMYRPLLWGFGVGAVAPVGIWLVGRKSKSGSVWRMINLPVVFGSVSWIPPATGINFSTWAIVCYIFNHALRRRATAWSEKYNMILSAALDAGLAFSLFVVFFAFIYPGWMDGFKWWGTEVYKQGCDWQACPLIRVPEGGHFGPDKWE